MQNQQRRSRLAILYPWSDLNKKSSGASLRVNLLLDFFDDYEIDVRVLHEGVESFWRSPTIQVEAFRLKKAAFWQRKRAKIIASLAHEAPSITAQRLKFERAANDEKFFEKLTNIVEWADIILLKYPFYFEAVQKCNAEIAKKVIVSAHDILHDQVRHSSLLRSEIKRLEMDAYCRADGVVAVSAADALRLREFNPNTVLIPHPVRFAGEDPQPYDDTLAQLAEHNDVSLTGKDICFFVGSDFSPNVDAVTQIRRIASAVFARADMPNLLFVVAGGCAFAEKSENLWCVGPVDESTLKRLYDASRIVVVPLRMGTGSSLKILEAFAASKAVIGTSVAFRGHTVENGKHCVIEDNLDLYPELLAKLLGNREQIATMGLNAVAYVRSFSFDLVFEAYWPVLGVHPNKKNASHE